MTLQLQVNDITITSQWHYNYKSMTFHVVSLNNGPVIFLEIRKDPGILKVLLLSQCLIEDWPNYVVSICFQLNLLPRSCHVSILNSHSVMSIQNHYALNSIAGFLKELRDSECKWKLTWRTMLINDSGTAFEK